MVKIGLGHEIEYSNLKNAYLNNRFAHAYLLWGESGTGKKEFALRIAKSIMCREEEFGVCDKCNNCKRFDHFSHPDVKVIFPCKRNKNGEAVFEEIEKKLAQLTEDPYHPLLFSGSESIAINDIRALKDEIKLSPIEGNKRLIIIFNIELMNASASNALLKILEEPPQDVRFILSTSKLDTILPTVKSRCQLLHMRQFSVADLSELLASRFTDKPAKDLEIISRLAGGNFETALQYLSEDIEEEQGKVVEFLRAVFRANAENINENIKLLYQNRDKSELRLFLRLILQWLEDLILVDQDEDWREKIIFHTQSEALYKFYQGFTGLDLQKAQDIIENCIHHLDHNGYIPLVITDMMIKFHKLMHDSVQKRRIA